jgi:hypothetical protein
MIAIAGPLTAASKGYTAAIDSKNQMIAMNLAQDGLEYLNFVKDITGGGSLWLPDLIPSCVTQSAPSGPTGACGASGIQAGSPADSDLSTRIKACSGFQNCALTVSDTAGYSYSSTGTPTPFTRYFYITNSSTDSTQVTATVVVRWQTGPTSNQVQLSEILTNYER